MGRALSPEDIRQRNDRIVELLAEAKGKPVHLQHIAYFLGLDPSTVLDWMTRYSQGHWTTGDNRHWWKLEGSHELAILTKRYRALADVVTSLRDDNDVLHKQLRSKIQENTQLRKRNEQLAALLTTRQHHGSAISTDAAFHLAQQPVPPH